MGGKIGLRQRGFALIGALLLLLLVTALAVTALYVVNNEQQVGGSDRQHRIAAYAAEAGMEKMTADLADLYQLKQSPTVADITALQAYVPSLPGITYREYTITVPSADGVHPSTVSRTISQGPNAGLIAAIVPMTLTVTAQRAMGEQVRMTREVEVSLIPVFQFGMFSDMDVAFHAGPSFDFTGRVHTNGNLFLADGDTAKGLVFHSKITVVKDVIRTQVPNGLTVSSGWPGKVYIPTTTNGCDAGVGTSSCRDLNYSPNEGSVVGGPGSAANTSWTNLSLTTYNGMILNGRTGAKPLTLPFVSTGAKPVEIIREPPAGEDPTSSLGQSRLYNEAQIRVLLVDQPSQFPNGGSESGDVQLDNASFTVTGIGSSATATGTLMVAQANDDSSKGSSTTDADWKRPGTLSAANHQWPLISGWLRVEENTGGGTWINVTQEWLGLGFARGFSAPASCKTSSACTAAGSEQPNSEASLPNAVNPNAILIFQVLADRNGNWGLDTTGSSPTESGAITNSPYNWFPINLYDTREGEPRDGVTGTTCKLGGVMNVVELDVGNLKKWLTGALGSTGTKVDSTQWNGYVLYFADRRGEQISPTAGRILGEYGYEDTQGSGTSGSPRAPLGSSIAPIAGEDVNGNGLMETYGAVHIGDGFGAAGQSPFTDISCSVARKNQVTGPRHGLKLVDGSLGNVPTAPDGTGGFTVASENPVYIVGDYNANQAGFGSPHAATAVIADSATLLSNNWHDLNSFYSPKTLAGRVASTTYYRLALAVGKSIYFPYPSWAGGNGDYGSDGGVHNFFRYLENWGGKTSNYTGSMVSFYYSQYATGIFKCCSTVYSPPTRAYAFDTDFLQIDKLPPATPKFTDIDNLGFQEDMTSQ